MTSPDPNPLADLSEELMLNALRLDLLNRDGREALARLKESGDPLAAEFERTLRVAEGLALEIKDMASGATLRRSQPMRDAMEKALASGLPEDWAQALHMLAQRALDTHSPMYFAGGVLDAFCSGPFPIPPQAYARLVEPLRMERSLGAPGYDWEWGDEPDHIRAKRCWDRAELSAMPFLKPPPPFFSR